MYGMVCTCPDISLVVSVVSMYMECLGKVHWQTIKWILRYLRGTVDVGLMFNKTRGLNGCVVKFVDFDCAGDHDKMRSLTDYIFTLVSYVVSWKETLHSTIALSTTEAEYMVATEAVNEAIWLRGLLGELGLKQGLMVMHCDS